MFKGTMTKWPAQKLTQGTTQKLCEKNFQKLSQKQSTKIVKFECVMDMFQDTVYCYRRRAPDPTPFLSTTWGDFLSASLWYVD